MSFTSDYNSRPTIQVDDFGEALNQPGDAPDTPRSLANRTPFYASSSSSSTEMNVHRADRPSPHPLIYPLAANRSTPSVCSTATATPIPSRTASPLYMQEDAASSCTSDSEEDDNELESRLLPDSHRRSYSLTNVPRWWTGTPSRRRKRDMSEPGTWKWAFRHWVLPFIPKTPLTIVCTLKTFCVVSLTVSFTDICPSAFNRIRHFSHSPHHIPLQS